MAYDPFSDGLIPVVWDSDIAPQYYMPMVNGFTKATALSYLGRSDLDLANAYMADNGWPSQLTIGVMPEDTWKAVSIKEKFIYPLSVHWWCSHNLELWQGHLKFPNMLVNLIQAKRGKILLNNMYEGWAADIWIAIVDVICSRYIMLTRDDFIVVSNNVAMCNTIKSIPHVNNQRYKQTSGPYATIDDMHAAIKKDLTNNVARSNKFVSLNRQPSPCRWIVMTLLFPDRHMGLLSFGVFTDLNSYGGQFNDLNAEYRNMIQERLKNENTLAWMAKNDFKILAPEIYGLYQDLNIEYELPLIIQDGIDIRTNPTADHSISKFVNSYLHIITETYMQDNLPNRMHFSEKTFKPMWYLQPFVMCGQRHSLRYLQDLGYKTFDIWIDERYDDISNDRDRTVAAINAAKKFYDKTETELNILLLEMMPILEHNYQQLQRNSDLLHQNLIAALRELL